MKATKNGWTVEGTPREIAELIGMVPARSLYEKPEWNRIPHDRKVAIKDFERMLKAERRSNQKHSNTSKAERDCRTK